MNLTGSTDDSGKITTALGTHEAHHDFIYECCPVLSHEEWKAVCAATNSSYVDDESWHQGFVQFMHMAIQDLDRYEGLGEKWECDAMVLADKIRVMTIDDRLAVIEVASCWLRLDKNSVSGDCLGRECLESCGAAISN